MALVPDQKFSTFQNGGDVEVGDTIVGLRGGINTRFLYTGELPPGYIVPIDQGGTGSDTAAGARTNLGLGTIAVQNANAVAITGGTAALTSGQVADAPVNPTDLANKAYVDGLDSGNVKSVTGTANQVLVNGTSGSAQTGAVTLTTPQSLDTTALFQVNTLQLNSNNGLLDSVGNKILGLSPVALATEYIVAYNGTSAINPAFSVDGITADMSIGLQAKGTGAVRFSSQSTTAPIIFSTGTTFQHETRFNFSDTAQTRIVTFPDATMTVVGTAAAMTNGQLAIGSTGGLPVAATLTAGAGISVTNSSGSITIAATGGGLTVATIAGTSQSAAVNTKYFALAAGQTTLTLPSVYAVGDIIALIGSTANTGGWIVASAAGDTIRVNNATTSAGGTVTSAAIAGQTIYLECDVANTSWVMTQTVSTVLTTS